MPKYDFRCPECSNEVEMIISWENSNRFPCPACGMLMEKTFRNFRPHVDQTLGYWDNQMGRYVGSTSERRRYEKELNLYAKEKGETIKPRRKTKEQKYEEYHKIIQDTAYDLKTVKVLS